jgi:formylglycine-generating enzyme required for sulfatase activity
MSRNLGVTIRLPTEAEWEYACRAGTSTPFAFGAALLPDQANFAAADPKKSPGKTVPVGSHKPNAWGLYDMHGNVWEWCQDTLQGDYEKAPADGSAWLDEAHNKYNRVRRGGSWKEPATNCRSAVRYGSSSSAEEPDMRNDQLGFRVVVDIPGPLQK